MELPSLLSAAGTVIELVGTVVMALDLVKPQEIVEGDGGQERLDLLLVRVTEALVERDDQKLALAHSDVRDAVIAGTAALSRGHRVESALRTRGKIGLVLVLAGIVAQIFGSVAPAAAPDSAACAQETEQ